MEPNTDWIIIVRTIALTELALLLGLLLKQRDDVLPLRLVQIFVACVLCYVLSEVFRPASIAARPPVIWYALVSIALTIPVIYWALAQAIFIDGFEWGKREWWVIGLYEVSSLGFLYLDFLWKYELEKGHLGVMVVPMLMRIALSIWTIYIVVSGWKVDLMETRRRLRLFCILVIGAYTVVALIIELIGVNIEVDTRVSLIQTSIIAASGFLFLITMSKVNIASLYTPDTDLEQDQPDPTENLAKEEICAKNHDERREKDVLIISDWDEQLKRIQDERIYAIDNMTISKLAELLSVPEYRLRRQIVKSMGFKNFNQFLNFFRVQEAASRLISIEEKKIPILSIALDVGFRSLPSFNRSFKDTFLMTPSEYRKEKATDSLDHLDSK